MTRTEFVDNVTSWWDLIDFCRDEDCDLCQDIYDEDSMDEEIDYSVREDCGNYGWRDLADLLDGIPTGYDAYRRNAPFDWDGLGDYEFDEYKEDVLSWMDDGDYWDEEDEDEAEGGAPNEVDVFAEQTARDIAEAAAAQDEESVVDEDFSVVDLIGMCSTSLYEIEQAVQQKDLDRVIDRAIRTDADTCKSSLTEMMNLIFA
jgi:hypothetical protein